MMVAWIPVMMSGLLAIGVEGAPEQEKAQRGRGPQNMSVFVEKVAEAVDASDEQLAQLEVIAEEHEQAMAATRNQRDEMTDAQREELSALRKQAREARRAGDDALAEKLRTQVQSLTAPSPREITEATHAKIAAVLKPEQLPAFRELVRAQRQGRGEGFGVRGRGGPGAGPGEGLALQRFIERVIVEVDATDEQQAQMKAIAEEHVESVKAEREHAAEARAENRERLQELQAEMREAQADGDEEAVQTIRAQVHELMGGPERGALMEAAFEKIGAVMTEAQKPAYDALVAETKERLAEPRGGFGGPRARRGDGPPEGRGFGRPGPRGPAPQEAESESE